MTSVDCRTLLEQAIAERNDSRGKGGAAQVARILEVSDGMISQYRKGSYPNPENVERRIREVLGGETVDCPELGMVTLAECSGHRKRGPTTDSFFARMFRACQTCKRKL